MATRPFLDEEKREAPLDVARCMILARKKFGKSLFSQISEMAKLSMGAGKLRPEEYYYYGLYDDSRYSYDQKARFLGKNAQNRIHATCNDLAWWAIADDKLVFYATMAGLGFRTPRIYAVYHPARDFEAAPGLANAEALAAFLRDGMSYPFFSKPVCGMYSVGVASVEAYDAESDSLALGGGDKVPVAGFVEAVAPFFEQGYLFQERLASAPEVARLSGAGMSTVRVMVLTVGDEMEIYRALWKIPSNGNVADNFWRRGNMLGAIDLETGRLGQVVRGVGPERELVETHPDSGLPLAGRRIPAWEKIRELVLTAARAFPGLTIQAWDVALTDAGPMLLELNIGGDFNLPQIASGTGLMEERLSTLIARSRARNRRIKANAKSGKPTPPLGGTKTP